MLLHGALVPPRAALEELLAVVQSGRRDPTPEPEGRRGLLRRRSSVVESQDVPPVLVDVPVEQLRLPITAFGNLTSSDSRRLGDALAEAAADWDRPTVQFAGGGALEFPGDRNVWARLDGDLDALASVARGVTSCVERLGLFVDRRIFRPMLAVASVTESTTGPDLDAVVGALQDFRGQSWEVDSVVLTTDPAGDGSALQEFERIPVGR